MSVGSVVPHPSGRHWHPPPLMGTRDWLPAGLPLAGLIVLGSALRFYGLGRQGFWFDEANTAQLVGFSPGHMVGLIPHTESTPPLYYCVVWIWARVFGASEAGLRSFSALCGVLVVPVAYGVGSLLANRRTGLIAAALIACNPLLIWYSQEARSYEMLVLLTSVALLTMVRAVIAPTTRALTVWVVASILALATHYYAGLVILPQSVWLLVAHRRRRPVQVAVMGVLACGAALIPLALAQNATGHDSWIANTSLSLRLAQIIPQFLIGTGAPDRSLLKAMALVGGVGALGLLAARADPAERRPALLAGALVLGGVALNLVLIGAGVDDLITRNVIALLAPAVILLAGGLGARRAGFLGLALTVLLCGVGVTAAAGVAADRNLQRPDWRLVAHALGPRPAPGRPARVILIQHYLTLLPLSLYLHGLRHLGAGGAVVDQLNVVSIRSPKQPLCWWGAACNLVPSRMQSSYPVPGFRVGWRRQVRQFTILHLVASRPVLLRPADIAPALRATRLPRDDVLVQQSSAR